MTPEEAIKITTKFEEIKDKLNKNLSSAKDGLYHSKTDLEIFALAESIKELCNVLDENAKRKVIRNGL